MAANEVVASVELELALGDPNQIRKKMDFCAKDRQQKGHFLHPSCGCVFKNDHSLGISSGQLLDEAGAKKLTVGAAEVSEHHANFIYNKGASALEILELSLLMREAVFRKHGVWLEYEMEILGVIPDAIAKKIK